jgi:hypothetical protein
MSDGVKVFAGGPYRRKNANGLKSCGKTESMVWYIDEGREVFLLFRLVVYARRTSVKVNWKNQNARLNVCRMFWIFSFRTVKFYLVLYCVI